MGLLAHWGIVLNPWVGCIVFPNGIWREMFQAVKFVQYGYHPGLTSGLKPIVESFPSAAWWMLRSADSASQQDFIGSDYTCTNTCT